MIRKPTDDEIAEAQLSDLQKSALTGELLRVAICELASADEEGRENRCRCMDLDPILERFRAKDARIEELERMLAATPDTRNVRDAHTFRLIKQWGLSILQPHGSVQWQVLTISQPTNLWYCTALCDSLGAAVRSVAAELTAATGAGSDEKESTDEA